MAGLILSNRTVPNRTVSNRTNGTYRDPFTALARDLFSWEPLIARDQANVATPFNPRVNVVETADSYVAEADLPGVREEDIEVTLDGRVLTIGGKREARVEAEGDKSHVVERAFGSFARSFTLPEKIDSEKINANLTAGVLTVTIPKTPEVLPRKIPVGSAT